MTDTQTTAELVQSVPPGGFWAVENDPQAKEALVALDEAHDFSEVSTPSLARLYLTAEDCNYHTLNVDVAAELGKRNVTYAEYEQLARD